MWTHERVYLLLFCVESYSVCYCLILPFFFRCTQRSSGWNPLCSQGQLLHKECQDNMCFRDAQRSVFTSVPCLIIFTFYQSSIDNLSPRLLQTTFHHTMLQWSRSSWTKGLFWWGRQTWMSLLWGKTIRTALCLYTSFRSLVVIILFIHSSSFFFAVLEVLMGFLVQ